MTENRHKAAAHTLRLFYIFSADRIRYVIERAIDEKERNDGRNHDE